LADLLASLFIPITVYLEKINFFLMTIKIYILADYFIVGLADLFA